MDKPIKIAVCYPWSVEFISTRFTDTLFNLERPADVVVRGFRGRGWCSARRHIHCCEQAKAWGADLILIVGPDQTYPEDTLVKLFGHWRRGCRAVCALVPMRGMSEKQGDKPFQPVGWRLKPGCGDTIKARGRLTIDDFETIDPAVHGDLVQIHAAGTGCILFPTEALDRIPCPWFSEYPSYPDFDRTHCADTPFITKLQTLAEIDIWCDTTIKVKHCQVFEVDETFSERFADWAKGGGDPSICAYAGEPSDVVRTTGG